MVILCGDFYQMLPVLGHALYWGLDTYSECESGATAEELTNVDLRETEESKGKRLWGLFCTVVLLTEQMR